MDQPGQPFQEEKNTAPSAQQNAWHGYNNNVKLTPTVNYPHSNY